jgi:hypothetical protein
MKNFFSCLLLSAVALGSASAKDLQVKLKEKGNNFIFSVKTEDIKKDSSKDVLNFFGLFISDTPLEGKDFKYQTVYSKIRLNCQDGTGEVSSMDLFKGQGISTEKIAINSVPQKIVKGAHVFLPKDLAFMVCTEAKVMGLASEPGAVYQPELLPGGTQPPTLELRVIQTRNYEANLKDFFEAFKEMCQNGGGSFIGFLPLSKSTESTKLMCPGLKLAIFKKFVSEGAHIESEVSPIDSTHVKVRLRIEDFLGTPAYNKFVYAAVFKEISDSLGVLDIPIDVKKAD